MTLKDQIINELEGLSNEKLIEVLSFIRCLKEGLSEHEQQKPSRKKVGYFSDKKYIADDCDFDKDNKLIAEEFTGEHYKDVLEVIKFFAEEKECDEPEETLHVCKAWEDQRAEGRAEGRLLIFAELIEDGIITIQEAANALGKTVEQATELFEALKKDSITKLVEDLKRAEERADKEGWLMAEEVRRSVE